MFIRIILPLFLVVFLAACGGGGGSSAGGVSFDPQDPSDTPKTPPSGLVPDHEPTPGGDGQKVVVLEWSPPTERENGEYLEEEEIGGYEIRYRSSEQEDFEVVTIEGGMTDEYAFTDLAGPVEFEIATYDRDGLYSIFVPLSGREEVL